MPDLDPHTRAAIDSYWSSFFGCAPSALSAEGTLVVGHVGLEGYQGLWLFRRRQTLIVSVPVATVDLYRRACGGLRTADFDRIDAVRAQLPQPIERIIGPASIAYTDRQHFRPRASAVARLLQPKDAAAYAALRQACGTLAWEHGGSAWGSQPLAGAFIGDTLAALAGYELWGAQIAHIAVVTHPAHRGQGHGAAVVSLLTSALLDRGLTPQYRTLRDNRSSLALGAALGFVAYAESIALRLA